MSDQQQTLSIPSLLLLAAFTALTIRYFFFTKSSPTASRGSPRTANPADVEQIAMMFPQIERRAIIWDLQRPMGSAAATTERILGRGSLDTPPASFQPRIPASATPSTAGSTPGQSKSEHVDLITRYNLGSKISSTPSMPSEGDGIPSPLQKQTWSNNKNERQALLQRRREEMILNARRKLEEKERQQRVQST